MTGSKCQSLRLREPAKKRAPEMPADVALGALLGWPTLGAPCSAHILYQDGKLLAGGQYSCMRAWPGNAGAW